MFSIGFNEILLIIFILLLAVGPGRVPGIARSIGKYMRYVSRAARDFKDALDIEELKEELDPRKIQSDINQSVNEVKKSVENDLDLDSLKKEMKIKVPSPGEVEKTSSGSDNIGKNEEDTADDTKNTPPTGSLAG